MKKYTDEQLKWIEGNLDAGVFRDQNHFTDVFNAMFDTDISYRAMATMLSRRKWAVKTIHNTPQWTAEMDEWLKAEYPKCNNDFADLSERLNAKFGTDKSNCCLQKHLVRIGVHTPLPKARCINKSHSPFTNKGSFKSGQKSRKGELPIGTIRYNSDGRPFIKVALSEGSYNKEQRRGHNYREPFWKPLLKKVWEDHYGEVPKGMEVCSLSGDPFDTDINHMCLLDRRAKARMAKNGWWDIDDVEIRRTAAIWCNLYYTLKDQGEKSDEIAKLV